uniref:Nucleotide binding site-leucine rich repeat protein n=1 Tax=Solanum tuberosum TaxID=4113 RepID=M1B7J2_SOLTU
MQPVARGFGYIFYYQSNIRCMDKESENLKNIRNVAAVMQRGTIEVERYGWCPNLKSRYSLSRSAKKITLKVIEFQNESNKSDVISFDHPIQNSKRIEGEITREIGLTLAGNKLWSREDQLRTRLTDQNSHILIILDDFQKTLDLKRLGIPSGSNRKHQCKVTFTTRFLSVCAAMGAQKTLEVECYLKRKHGSFSGRKSGDLRSVLVVNAWPPAALPRKPQKIPLSIDPRPDLRTVGKAIDRGSMPQIPASVATDGRPAQTIGQSTYAHDHASRVSLGSLVVLGPVYASRGYVIVQLYLMLHAQYLSSTDAYYAVHLLVTLIEVLSFQITHRLVPNLQFSSISGESSFFEDY